ncbi:hypothetical protein COCSADRAFT_38271 [Bipolaris sorokiniana ND90Pr]|uniref:Uncharacterized protein n=1 Tax=Cochliobolus sativus (strain ND90Pr / ATCC 201652) TaxID=665912 RepID=M2SIV4_COCSN|nr:uncharacterized protein COCSADRAFT_38271 [Bipolaris sorokiniana ND90Pr]EMD62315.1 hypothetical protein COCSADRAFT_38271 [Bipolaris sorokiniana ND90Pr]
MQAGSNTQAKHSIHPKVNTYVGILCIPILQHVPSPPAPPISTPKMHSHMQERVPHPFPNRPKISALAPSQPSLTFQNPKALYIPHPSPKPSPRNTFFSVSFHHTKKRYILPASDRPANNKRMAVPCPMLCVRGEVLAGELGKGKGKIHNTMGIRARGSKTCLLAQVF